MKNVRICLYKFVKHKENGHLEHPFPYKPSNLQLKTSLSQRRISLFLERLTKNQLRIWHLLVSLSVAVSNLETAQRFTQVTHIGTIHYTILPIPLPSVNQGSVRSGTLHTICIMFLSCIW